MPEGVTIKGYDTLKKHLDQMANAPVLLDPVVRVVALNNNLYLKENTNRNTGNTAGAWKGPKKLGPSQYVNTNDVKTSDGKHLIVTILNDGRGVVRPIHAKFLYIPLTKKGQRKKAGEEIPKGFIFGVDYVLAKEAKAFKGTKVKEKAKSIATRELTTKIINKIREVHR